MQYFQISDEILRQVIQQGLSLGADYVDIFLEHSSVTQVSLLPQGENRASQNIDYGAGIRVVCGEKTGFSYTEQITPESLLAAVRQASFICRNVNNSSMSSATGNLVFRPLSTDCLKLYPNTALAFQPDGPQIGQLVDYLRVLREKLLAADSRILNAKGNIRNQVRRIAIVNSLGICCEEECPMTDVSLSAVIKQDSITESAGCSRSYRRPLSMLTDKLQKELIDETLHKLHFALEATQPKGGEMPVVMGAGASGILLHEAIGHAFEADFIRRGESIFTNSLGKQICDSSITVVDDGLLPEMRGSIHFDDEGVQSKTTNIVTEGHLTSFMHDRISAKHFGIEPTGNGRREGFRSMPFPRMRNTYMLGGPCKEADLIAEVKNGIYVSDFTNGQVSIGAGDYSFFVKGGYLIENGHLTRPIKDVNIIGNGPQTLADIRAVADNPLVDPSTWTCGKEGQSVPVSCGMPSVLVSKLTVG